MAPTIRPVLLAACALAVVSITQHATAQVNALPYPNHNLNVSAGWSGGLVGNSGFGAGFNNAGGFGQTTISFDPTPGPTWTMRKPAVSLTLNGTSVSCSSGDTTGRLERLLSACKVSVEPPLNVTSPSGIKKRTPSLAGLWPLGGGSRSVVMFQFPFKLSPFSRQ